MKKLDVLNHFGGTTKTAKALGISHVSVCQWKEDIPLLRAYQIEEMTNGKLKVEPQSVNTNELTTG